MTFRKDFFELFNSSTVAQRYATAPQDYLVKKLNQLNKNVHYPKHMRSTVPVFKNYKVNKDI